MAFCTNCGVNVPDDVKFCTACGQPMGTASPAAVPSGAAPPRAAAVSEPPPVTPVYTQPQPAPVYAPQQPALTAAASAPTDKRYAVMSTGSFVLTSILFAIPVIGQIACIIMAFAAKNLNRKHFARAMLIFMIIGLVLSVILFFIGRWVLDAAASYLNVAGLTNSPDGLTGLLDLLNELN